MTQIASALRAPSLSAWRPRFARAGAPARAALRVPLAGKLAGASALVVAVAAAALFWVHGSGASEREMIVVMIGALVLGLIADLVLVYVALLPLRELETTAERVAGGDYAARVPSSPIADRRMARLATTFNRLLVRLLADNARARRLASEVIRAGDAERSRISRDLHDSAAQTLAALMLEATSASHESCTPELTAKHQLIRDLAGQALEEVRLLSLTIHPRILEDLGLKATLDWLARRTHEQSGLHVTVDVAGDLAAIPLSVASVLYRVAQEALSNAVRHGAPDHVQLVLTAIGGAARLEVADNGRGFDTVKESRRRRGVGLFTTRERLALVDGILEVYSTPGHGTRLRATVPLTLREQLSGDAHYGY